VAAEGVVEPAIRQGQALPLRAATDIQTFNNKQTVAFA
jgi:hypothetical protein